MSKFNVVSKYVAAVPRSQRRKGAGVFSAPSSGVAGSGIDKNTLSQFVDIYSPQTVEGLKNFLNGLLLGGKLVKYDTATNAFVFPANAVFEGGVAWNSKLDGFSVPSIMDAIKVDDSTISKANGYLEFVGETGGGTASSVAWGNITGKPTWIGSSKPNYTFSEISSKPTTLAGYGITDAYTKNEVSDAITEAFNDFASKVSNDGVVNTYKELIDYAATHGADFTTLVGVVNGKADKATTLAGYGITNAYTKAEVNSALDEKWTQNNQLISDWNTAFGWGNHATAGYAKKSDIPSLSGYATESFVTSRGYITSAAISKANIKSILGISDWALGSSSPFATLGKISTEIDSDSLLTGVGYTQDYSPVEGAYIYGQLLNFNGYRGHTQFYIPSGGNTIYLRSHWDPTGMASRTWKEILTSGSYAKHALSLTTDQDVAGIKNFVNGFKVGGNLITYDTSLKAFVLNSNLIVKGGIAWEKQNS